MVLRFDSEVNSRPWNRGRKKVVEETGGSVGIAEEDTLRAELYGLLGWLLRAPLSRDDLARAAALEGDDSDLGEALTTLAAVARAARPEAVEDEYHTLFVGVSAGELTPYASYYLTGFTYEKPLAKLRIEMEKLGIAKSDDVSEPEDHIAALCEMMAGLITGAFGTPADLATQQRFFDTHMAPWAGKFFEDLEVSASAALYMPVGTIGKLFMGIETQAFQMAA